MFRPSPTAIISRYNIKRYPQFRNIYRAALVETGQTFVHTRVLRRPDRPSQIRPSLQVRRICPENKHHGWNIHSTWFVSVSQFHTPETSREAPHFEWLHHSEHLNNSPYRKDFWKNISSNGDQARHRWWSVCRFYHQRLVIIWVVQNCDAAICPTSYSN